MDTIECNGNEWCQNQTGKEKNITTNTNTQEYYKKKEDRIKTFILLVKQLLSKTETYIYIYIDSFENVFQSNQATLYFNISFLSNKMNVKIHCKL